MMPGKDVVIIGAGLITPLGRSIEENWRKVVTMKTGIVHEPRNDAPSFLTYKGKVGDIELPTDIPPKLLSQMKFLNRGSLLGLVSACEALSRCGVEISTILPERRALYIGTGDFAKVGYEFMFEATRDATEGKWQEMDYEKLNRETLDKVNPFFLLESIYNNLFSFLSAYVEFMGPNTSLASLSPSGAQAVEHAYRCIKQGKADVALAVGCCTWISEMALYELEGLGILSQCRHGEKSFRPFDVSRDGFIAGEGGSALLLASAETARATGAVPMGVIKGFGDTIEFTSRHGMEVPRDVSSRSMRMAVEEADITVADLACIIPHGSGTRKGDSSELHALRAILGRERTDIPVCALKPYTGHMGAASDIAEIIFGLLALQNRFVPATLNFQKPERAFADVRISGSPGTCEKRHVLSISYGAGGQSSAVVFSSATGYN